MSSNFPSNEIDVSGDIVVSDIIDPSLLQETNNDPFAMLPKALERFNAGKNDIRSHFRGRALETTVQHMSNIEFERSGSSLPGAAALNNPGLLAIGRALLPVNERESIHAANPDWAETPFIKAAETLNKTIFDEEREATPAEKQKLGQLMILGIQYLDSLDPGKNKQLSQYVAFLKEEGFVLGDHIPATISASLSSDLSDGPNGLKGGP